MMLLVHLRAVCLQGLAYGLDVDPQRYSEFIVLHAREQSSITIS